MSVIAYVASNVLALGLLIVARRWPGAGRVLLAIGFFAAAVFNARTAVTDPASYLSFASTAVAPYAWLIEHVFARAPSAFVFAIAGVQLVGALALGFGDRSLARIGGGVLVAFLIAIAPFGVGSAFPASLILALAVWYAASPHTLPKTVAPGTGRVLVTYGSKEGGTAELAERVAETLHRQHLVVDCKPVAEVAALDAYDTVIVGGALYAGRWIHAASRFVTLHEASLRARAVWMFSSGPLDDSAAHDLPPPRPVAKLIARAAARGHATFGGRLAPDARGWVASAMAKKHAGDWRDWRRVEAWALDIARALGSDRPSRVMLVEARRRDLPETRVH